MQIGRKQYIQDPYQKKLFFKREKISETWVPRRIQFWVVPIFPNFDCGHPVRTQIFLKNVLSRGLLGPFKGVLSHTPS